MNHGVHYYLRTMLEFDELLLINDATRHRCQALDLILDLEYPSRVL